MEFNSQICTSREQSERLLALGLKKETADMYYSYDIICAKPYYKVMKFMNGCVPEDIFPAWSLHRLIDMMPESLPTEMAGIQGLFHISRHSDMTFTVGYTWSLDMKGSLYDVMISAYEWLIKEGYFSKEYLVNQ